MDSEPKQEIHGSPVLARLYTETSHSIHQQKVFESAAGSLLSSLTQDLPRETKRLKIREAVTQWLTSDCLTPATLALLGRKFYQPLRKQSLQFEDVVLVAEQIMDQQPGEDGFVNRRIIAGYCQGRERQYPPEEAYFLLAAQTAFVRIGYSVDPPQKFKDLFLSRLRSLERDDPVQLEARMVIAQSLSNRVAGGFSPDIRRQIEAAQRMLLASNKVYFEDQIKDQQTRPDLLKKVALWLEEEAVAGIRRGGKADEALAVLQEARRSDEEETVRIIDSILLNVAQDVYLTATNLFTNDEAGREKYQRLIERGLQKIWAFYPSTNDADMEAKKAITIRILALADTGDEPLGDFQLENLRNLVTTTGLENDEKIGKLMARLEEKSEEQTD